MASGPTARFYVRAATFDAGANLTVRRFIFDWEIDITDESNAYTVYANAKLGIGVTYTTADSGTPPDPAAGPLEEPDYPWWYWSMPGYSGIPWQAAVLPEPFLKGSGRIDTTINHTIDNTVNTSVWLVGNLFDGDSIYDFVWLSSGSQILTQTTGA